MSRSDHDELLRRYDEELEARGGDLVSIKVDVGSLLVIVGSLQLAMRHPEYPQDSKATLCEFIEAVAAALDPGGSSAIAAVLDRCFDPVYGGDWG